MLSYADRRPEKPITLHEPGRPTFRSWLMMSVAIKVRVDFGPHCAIGPGKMALLESIGATGSLSEAARRLGMSYRRAWLLLNDVNTSFQQPVARMSIGGHGGGGAVLTPFGAELVRSYRAFEIYILKRARSAFAPAAAAAVSGPHEGKDMGKRPMSRTRRSSKRPPKK
jgi:molybdate transport system regulatory protein